MKIETIRRLVAAAESEQWRVYTVAGRTYVGVVKVIGDVIGVDQCGLPTLALDPVAVIGLAPQQVRNAVELEGQQS